jgi:metallophosphoesterase (TIGR00282 family)
MKLLFVGDVCGAAGLRAAVQYIRLRRDDVDAVVVNGENVTNGRGLSRKHFGALIDAGADVVTLGNHSFDQREALEYIEETPRLLRPLNLPRGVPGLGVRTFDLASGDRLTVMQLMGRVFMDAIDDPFRVADEALESVPLDAPVLVDMHAEATSEKKVMGWHLRGRVAAVLGTHTHVQTSDERIDRGTAYLTDVGMTGVEDSAIGAEFPEIHHRFTQQTPKRYRPAEGRAMVQAAELTIDGLKATAIARVRWVEPQP